MDEGAGTAMPAGARLEFVAFTSVERDIKDAVRIVFGIEAGPGDEPVDGSVEDPACGEAEVEEYACGLRFGLRRDLHLRLPMRPPGRGGRVRARRRSRPRPPGARKSMRR